MHHYELLSQFFPLRKASRSWFLLSCCGRRAQAMCLRTAATRGSRLSVLLMLGEGCCCFVKTHLILQHLQLSRLLLDHFRSALQWQGLWHHKQGCNALQQDSIMPNHGCIKWGSRQSAQHTWAGLVEAAGAGAAGELQCVCELAGICTWNRRALYSAQLPCLLCCIACAVPYCAPIIVCSMYSCLRHTGSDQMYACCSWTGWPTSCP